LRWWPLPVLPLAATVVVSLLSAAPAPSASPGDGSMAPPPFITTASHSPMPNSCSGSNACTETVVAPAGWKFTLYRNFPMSGSSAVTRAVIVVHGTGRNAGGYFASVAAAAQKSGVASSTMVIAPWFKTSQDSPGSGEATWTSGAWKIGEGAQSPSGLSSFLVMDQLIATLADKSRYPNLRDVVVTGHSAGGQFTQRYAAFGLAPNVLHGIRVTYVPANPSSYVYFTSARPTGSGFTTSGSSSCSAYDTYKYGLKGRSGYPAKLSASQVMANYTSRQITYVNGGADTFNNGDMDSDCGAMLEGPNRATRGANYLNYIHSIAPNTASTQRRIVVNGVDHDGDAIFNDPAVRQALFNSGGAGDTANRVSTADERSTNSVTTSSVGDNQGPATTSSSSSSSSSGTGAEQSTPTSSDDTREQ
jgi:hypothetical protein